MNRRQFTYAVSAIASRAATSIVPGGDPRSITRLPASEQVKAAAGQFEAILVRQFLEKSVGNMLGGDSAGPGASQVVMVGDNPVADVQGAAGAGIPGLLLDRRGDEPVPGAFRSLAEVADALLAGQWQPHAPVAAARRG